MTHLFLFLKALIFLGVLLQLVGITCFLFFRFRKRAPLPLGPLPGLTIIKPCFKNEDGEDRNFEAYFKQNYVGPFELIFVVSEESDPIVPIVEEYQKRFPHVSSKLIVSKTRKAYWRKIDAYYDGYQESSHELVVISDSDTMVNDDYISQMVAALCEPGISVVTVPQYDTGIDNFATALKTLGNNCDVAVYVMLMNAFVRRKKVAWGHSFGFKKSEFNEFGEKAWERVRNYFGDDLVLPTLFSEIGKKVVYRNIFCPVRYSGKTLSQMLDQQKRFALCQKAALGPWVFVLGLGIFPQIIATLYVLLSLFNLESLKLFVLVWAVRVFVSLIFEKLIFGTIKPTLIYFWTIPLWDLLKVYFSYNVFGQTQVHYHGRSYRVAPDTRLIEVSPDSNDIQATRSPG